MPIEMQTDGSMTETDVLTDIEERFWTGDHEFFRERLAEDCKMVFPGMGIIGREAAIEGIATGQRWDSVQMSDTCVDPLGNDIAIVTYEATAFRDGKVGPYRAYVSSVYRKGGNGWELALHQHSPAE